MSSARPRLAPLPPSGSAWSVSEIVSAADELLATAFADVRVAGELSGVRHYGSGHCYFTLRDEGASVSGVIWRSALRNLKFRPEDGLEVVVRGTLGIYPSRGQFQIQVTSMEPVGIGALALAFEQLKKKLELEGLFAPERKRPIPMLPSLVGIVTSKEGAALQDILRVLGRRHSGLRVAIADTRVQGDGAAEEIARAIRLLNEWGRPDVLIVGRGGGSAEDLWAFNEEVTVRAIAASTIPVISAVGHEVDFTLADYAADRRAPTPSAAAEEVVSAREELLRRVGSAEARLVQSLKRELGQAKATWIRLDRSDALAGWPARVARNRSRLDDAVSRLASAPRVAVERLASRLDRAGALLLRWPAVAALGEKRARIDQNAARLARAMATVGETRRARIGSAANQLTALSPLAVLGRGYAIVFREQERGKRRSVSRAADVEIGESIRIRLHEGEVGARVTQRSVDAPPEQKALFVENGETEE